MVLLLSTFVTEVYYSTIYWADTHETIYVAVYPTQVMEPFTQGSSRKSYEGQKWEFNNRCAQHIQEIGKNGIETSILSKAKSLWKSRQAESKGLPLHNGDRSMCNCACERGLSVTVACGS